MPHNIQRLSLILRWNSKLLLVKILNFSWETMWSQIRIWFLTAVVLALNFFHIKGETLKCSPTLTFKCWHVLPYYATIYRKTNIVFINSIHLVLIYLEIQRRALQSKYTTFFYFYLKRYNSQTLKSSNCKKTFSPVCVLLSQLVSINVFIPCEKWEDIAFLYFVFKLME